MHCPEAESSGEAEPSCPGPLSRVSLLPLTNKKKRTTCDYIKSLTELISSRSAKWAYQKKWKWVAGGGSVAL